jgi:hypothetical protein
LDTTMSVCRDLLRTHAPAPAGLVSRGRKALAMTIAPRR